ncbi:hypothetical protein PVK06_042019 [Gossypium arboreum]|uniref:Uncharacterized protein n=1 Tax=Gossypium arboreum TaxID=29729 RepID=A0ABR0NC11_GOSAR|nr:hypothetical protein PVK06_042019 [Gossypium arboreum]
MVIEGDAQSIIRKLQIEQDDRSVISAYIKDSKELSKKKANGLAHIPVTKGIRRGEDTYLEGRVPDFVVAEAEHDRNR